MSGLDLDAALRRLFPQEDYNERIPDTTRYVNLFGIILDFQGPPIVFTEAQKKHFRAMYKTKETPEIAALWTAFMRKPCRDRWKAWSDAVIDHHKVEAARLIKPSVARADRGRDELVKEILTSYRDPELEPQKPKLILPKGAKRGSGDPLLDAERELLRQRVRRQGISGLEDEVK